MTTVRFGNQLINSNLSWFRYDLVWEKYNSVGFLCANKMPLRSHEMIYIFNSSNTEYIELNRNLEMRTYAKKIYEYIKKSKKQIFIDFGNSNIDHFFRFGSSQFTLPTQETYNKLIELYEINKMDGYLKYNEMGFESVRYIYNPQKTPGKPYKVKLKENRALHYGKMNEKISDNTTGDRHPLSVIKCHQSDEKLHPTQKPSDLCEWLIKTYSNENDVVLDFCMGSGSSIIGCINSNRQYIGIEKDKTIFEVRRIGHTIFLNHTLSSMVYHRNLTQVFQNLRSSPKNTTLEWKY